MILPSGTSLVGPLGTTHALATMSHQQDPGNPPSQPPFSPPTLLRFFPAQQPRDWNTASWSSSAQTWIPILDISNRERIMGFGYKDSWLLEQKPCCKSCQEPGLKKGGWRGGAGVFFPPRSSQYFLLAETAIRLRSLGSVVFRPLPPASGGGSGE